MQSYFGLVITLSCITIIPGILIGVLWYISTRQGWNKLSILALFITILLMIITVVLWIATQDRWILVGGLAISIFQGVVILSWPKISSKYTERLKLRR
jgi:hypothetical protein